MTELAMLQAENLDEEQRKLLRDEKDQIKKALYREYGDQIRAEMNRIEKDKINAVFKQETKSREQILLELKTRDAPVRQQLHDLQNDILKKLGAEAQAAGQSVPPGTRMDTLETLQRNLGHNSTAVSVTDTQASLAQLTKELAAGASWATEGATAATTAEQTADVSAIDAEDTLEEIQA
eukprot:NODE_1732_length_1235_cov_56.412455_g1717_i0.p1 GENE.NODE_1732_length_1235_cov_56.412455_g1717_i0~~NODE_1732_length_1235_cov_56.412455_g1717_i0.p1  ORF type:complete len:205 (-),score=44.03 NODE_1732_length_1235_cov_56.412455_g1717_i0:620-1156(-)